MSGIFQSLIGTSQAAAAPVVRSMTIGSRTVTYSLGKIFDYYDSIVTSPGSDANITVTQDTNCTIQLTGAGGSTNNSGSTGGGGQALTFTFTFKAGTTYVLRLGTVANENSSTNGGGYSGLFIGSVSSTNAIAVVGGGGGGAWISGGAAYAPATGGPAGSVGPTAVTNGIGFAGAAGGFGTAPAQGLGGSGSAAGAAGTFPGGTSGTAGTGQLASPGGAGGTSGTYVGGGGGGGWYSGGGGAANSATPNAGGGGGGGTFLYTAATDPTKTAVYSSSRSGSFVVNLSADASTRPFVGRAGGSGLGSAGTTTYLQWWTTLSSWLRPIPGGAATVLAVPASYECALGADVPAGVGTTAISLVYKVVTTAIANVGATTISIGDCRRLIASGTTFEVAVASPYTLSATGASTAGITVSALAAAIPSGTTLYIYPVSSTTATTAGAITPSGVSGYSFSNSSFSPIQIAEPGGTYIYGFAPQGLTTTFTGGTTTPVTMTLVQAIYPSATLPKGSAVRIAKPSGEFALSLGVSAIRGAAPGAVRITMN